MKMCNNSINQGTYYHPISTKKALQYTPACTGFHLVSLPHGFEPASPWIKAEERGSGVKMQHLSLKLSNV